MIITVTARPGATRGTLTFGDKEIPCSLGRSGLVPEAEKTEGDGATPIGRWPVRRLLYRADRIERPGTTLPAAPIGPADGWCDAPDHADYNQPVTLPHEASCETLTREDGLYDLIVVLGHNDAPVVPDKGSAIFLHVAKETGGTLRPTEGCIAVPLDSLTEIVRACDEDTLLEIRADDTP
jgi:L,D-peptidoglycan transpeptidase YkuD (ErfK/YbiS/YcfS/YnhG family)